MWPIVKKPRMGPCSLLLDCVTVRKNQRICNGQKFMTFRSPSRRNGRLLNSVRIPSPPPNVSLSLSLDRRHHHTPSSSSSFLPFAPEISEHVLRDTEAPPLQLEAPSMEPADIDWKRLEWRFVKDDIYEHFNAPKWVDLSSPTLSGGSPSAVPDDEAWFCRPDCQHPKTAEDFLSMRPSPPACQRKIGKAFVSPLGERNLNKNGILRDANLKRRGVPPPSAGESPISTPAAKKKSRDENLENQDPNLRPETPERAIAKNPIKETIKSSAERREPTPANPPARNLFPKKEILTQISEFCHEIKKLAMPRRDHNRGLSSEKPQDMLVDSKIRKKVEEPKKETNTSRREERTTNKPGLLQEIRSCPPTPQRIASPMASQQRTAGIAVTGNPAPPSIQGILREMVEMDEDDEVNKAMNSPASSESKTLDLFWFLKPCASYL